MNGSFCYNALISNYFKMTEMRLLVEIKKNLTLGTNGTSSSEKEKIVRSARLPKILRLEGLIHLRPGKPATTFIKKFPMRLV